MKRYEKLIVDLSPILIGRKVTVSYIEDSDIGFQGCTKRWKADSYIFEVNLAFHDIDDPQQNYELLLHEMAHHREQPNDHLNHAFYEAVNVYGFVCTDDAIQPQTQTPTDGAVRLTSSLAKGWVARLRSSCSPQFVCWIEWERIERKFKRNARIDEEQR